jgi:hypothetical protein
VWKPTWLPEGFELAAAQPEIGSDMAEPVHLNGSVWLEWTRGDDRIYYVMAVGDYGDSEHLDMVEVDWGSQRAMLVRADTYYRGDPRVCISVRSALGPIQGIGVTEDEMKRMAASMVLVEPTERWEDY